MIFNIIIKKGVDIIKHKKTIIILIITIIVMFAGLIYFDPAQADKGNNLTLVDSTAYYDKYNYGIGADGRPLVEGLTIAGAPEYLGMSAALYDTDMNYIGTFEFRDVGYGQSTGKGQSKLLKGKSKGTIETGQCIDIYFDTLADCKAWGRRKVYMQIIKARG